MPAGPAGAQTGAPAAPALPSPFPLIRTLPGQPFWTPILRMRQADSRYRGSADWWDTYLGLRAQTEAAAGDHAAALRYADGDRPARAAAPTDSAAPGAASPPPRTVDALRLLGATADTSRVIMVNERHHAASDRLLTLRLLPVLYAKGFRYLAAETFSDADTALNRRGYALNEVTGHYTGDPVFAEVVREARRLGYTLVPYEMTEAQRARTGDGFTPQQRRDHAQAENLVARTLGVDPRARVLVHAGPGHIEEAVKDDWHPMAVYFRALSGVDPVTVDQTVLSERSAAGYEHARYRAAADAGQLRRGPVVLADAAGRPMPSVDFAADVQVLSPHTTYTAGRPDWMAMDGRRRPVAVRVPECRARWCFLVATAADEPAGAAALDRTEVRGSDRARLFLPPGRRVRVVVQDSAWAPVRTLTVGAR